MFQCISDAKSKKNKHSKSQCEPNMIYVQDDITCLCNKRGQWPHERCDDIFLTLSNELRTECEPNSYVKVDCNICRCDSDGKIDSKHCTKNKCKKSRRKSRRSSSQMFGSCKAGNWYSMAPCQFCYCANDNKLICNTGRHYLPQLEVGNSNFSICGKNLIQEATELIPKNDNTLRGQKPSNEVFNTQKEGKVPYQNFISIENEEEIGKFGYDNKPVDEYAAAERNPNYNENTEKKEMLRKLPTANTQIPYQSVEIYSSNSIEEHNLSEEDNRSSKNIAIDAYVQTSRKPNNNDKETSDKFINDLKKLEDNLRIDFPGILDKVFKIAIRKSMVTLSKNKECAVGTIEIVKCNTCYCLKSGKMLCTNKTCK